MLRAAPTEFFQLTQPKWFPRKLDLRVCICACTQLIKQESRDFMNANLQSALLVTALIGAGTSLSCIAAAQGMPPEARRNIHLMFNQHEAVQRTVTMTKDGYVSLTESDAPKVAGALKGHVRQMEDCLKASLMVRRHDPAFAEFPESYDQMAVVIEPTEKGLRVSVTGTTPAAVNVAQNHANVVTDFATHGWEGHDREHAGALNAGLAPEPATPKGSPPACCRNGGECVMGGAGRPSPAGVDTNSVAIPNKA